MNIVTELFNLQDLKYRDFSAKIIPNVDKNTIIGVRTPELKKFAKSIYGTDEVDKFLCKLPHKYFEENQLHAFFISLNRDFDTVCEMLDRFLPFVDNWATCDQIRPKAFKKNMPKLKEKAEKWVKSKDTYTIRYGIEVYMTYFLDDGFAETDLDVIKNIKSDEYYVNMMRAWYFATALSKQYEPTSKLIFSKVLDTFTQNKSIQKARESYRITDEQKELLNKYKV